MYNRYIPDANGGYRRMEVGGVPCGEASNAEPSEERRVRKQPTQGAKCGMDTDDLLILLILLLLLQDGEETDRLYILTALAAFILL